MTQEEKELRLQQLNELQFKLKKEIERGDEHAIKCVKKGLVYSEEYPDEYASYLLAVKQYNENQEEIEYLQTIITEDHHTVE